MGSRESIPRCPHGEAPLAEKRPKEPPSLSSTAREVAHFKLLNIRACLIMRRRPRTRNSELGTRNPIPMNEYPLLFGFSDHHHDHPQPSMGVLRAFATAAPTAGVGGRGSTGALRRVVLPARSFPCPELFLKMEHTRRPTRSRPPGPTGLFPWKDRLTMEEERKEREVEHQQRDGGGAEGKRGREREEMEGTKTGKTLQKIIRWSVIIGKSPRDRGHTVRRHSLPESPSWCARRLTLDAARWSGARAPNPACPTRSPTPRLHRGCCPEALTGLCAPPGRRLSRAFARGAKRTLPGQTPAAGAAEADAAAATRLFSSADCHRLRAVRPHP